MIFSISPFIKRLLIFFAVLLLLLALLGNAIQAYMLKQQTNQSDFLKSAYQQDQVYKQGQARLMKQVRDSLGRERTTVHVLTGKANNYEQLARAQDKFLLEKLRLFERDMTNLHKAVKDVKSITNFTIKSDAEFLTIMHDSIIDPHILVKDTSRVRLADTVKVYVKWFKFKDPLGWYEISGMVNQDTLKVDKLSMRNEFDLMTRKQPRAKRGWIDWPKKLRRKETVLEIINQNPYSHTENARQYTIK